MSILSFLTMQRPQADTVAAPKRHPPSKRSLYKRKANDPRRLLQALASLCFVLALIPILDMITLAAAESLPLPRLPSPPSQLTLGESPSLRTDLGAHYNPAKEVFGFHEPPPELGCAYNEVAADLAAEATARRELMMKILLAIALASAGVTCVTFPRWGRRWAWAKALFIDEDLALAQASKGRPKGRARGAIKAEAAAVTSPKQAKAPENNPPDSVIKPNGKAIDEQWVDVRPPS